MSLCYNFPPHGFNLRKFGNDTLDFKSYGSVIGKKIILKLTFKIIDFNNNLSKNQDGIGQLKVIDGGVQLEGQAIILDQLKTSHVRSRHGQPITFGNVKNC